MALLGVSKSVLYACEVRLVSSFSSPQEILVLFKLKCPVQEAED